MAWQTVRSQYHLKDKLTPIHADAHGFSGACSRAPRHYVRRWDREAIGSLFHEWGCPVC